MGVKIGIDLGTTFSAVSRLDPLTGLPVIVKNTDDESITPSVIWFRPDGTTICGHEAMEACLEGQSDTVRFFKRNMGTNEICISCQGHNYTAKDLSTILLKHLKKETEVVLGDIVEGAVITVPAYFHNAERMDTLNAAKAAGLKVLRIINEPTAAALDYGQGHWRENAIVMVYDLGGGTFDVTLVGMGHDGQLESLCTDGDHKLGGKDWDERLANLIIREFENETELELKKDTSFHQQIFSRTENWKKALSRPMGEVTCTAQVPGVGTTSVTITRKAFEKATQDLLEKTGLLCQRVLQKKGLDWSNITDILLVGGSTRMPQVSEYLTSKLGKPPISHVNPDETVSRGAAIQTTLQNEDYSVYIPTTQKPSSKNEGAAILSRYSGPVGKAHQIMNIACIGKRDVQGHGMGIVSVNSEGTEYINENVIPPNSPIPVKSARKLHFYTSAKEPNEMEVYVLEGTDKPYMSVVNAKYTITGITHQQQGTDIRVQYSFDRNGVIHVQARQGAETCDLPIREEKVSADEMAKFSQPIEKSVAQSDVTFILAVDVSGSMNGTPLCNAKAAMCDFVNKCEEKHAQVGALVVSDRVEWVIHPTNDYRACINAINRIRECQTGVCNAAHPFDYIYEEFLGKEGDLRAIVMADGKWENQPLAVTQAKRCQQIGIQVYGMGFGSADKQFLSQISSSEDFASFTASSADLGKSFGKIAQSLGGQAKHGAKDDGGVCETWDTAGW